MSSATSAPAAKVAALAKSSVASYITSARRNQFDHIYTTLEDFMRADPKRKRLVVIGCTGSGKSTLLNTIAGWRFVQSRETDYEFRWQPKPPPEGSDAEPMAPIFEATSSSDSVTKVTAFANVHVRGDAERELVVVDTPGHDDPAGCDLDDPAARDALGELAADLHNKLKALGHLHAILVLHNDVLSNRLNPATYQILKMVDEKFQKAGASVWEHVIVGFSKCNGHETSWRSGLEAKRKALCQAIRAKIPNCHTDVPVIALGGGEIEPPPPSHDESDGLERLWEFVSRQEALDTSRLMPFEGADVKWQKLIDERDRAAAEAKASLIYVAVALKVLGVVGALLWRHLMLPSWLSLFLLNMPGLYDELLILTGVVYWIGPNDVFFSLRHLHVQWVLPLLIKHLGLPRETAADPYAAALKYAQRWASRAGVGRAKPKKE